MGDDMSKKTINYVLEGSSKDKEIFKFYKNEYLSIVGVGWDFTKKNIESYTVIDETNKEQYSFWKGALGVALFGGAGAIAGVNGKTRKEYLIAIEWKDGEKSLILIDDEYYKVFVKSMF